MDVTASFKRQKPVVNPLEDCGQPGQLGKDEQRVAMYNPFVEARFAAGLKSSCVHCHALASTNAYRPNPLVPDVGHKLEGPVLRDLEAHLRLDYMWLPSRSLRPTRHDIN